MSRLRAGLTQHIEPGEGAGHGLPPRRVLGQAVHGSQVPLTFRAIACVGVAPDEPRFRSPLERDTAALATSLSRDDVVVLLGSIATGKYVDVIERILDGRLKFPSQFVGRGDMSRGGLMLRCVRNGQELEYVSFAGAVRRCLATADSVWFGYGDPRGSAELRTALAAHLAATRGLRCDPGCILITSGTQQGLRLCAEALLQPGDTVWLEDPGYPAARRLFDAVGAGAVAVPVDGAGLMVEAGRRRAPGARLAYVTPSHQFPTGVAMSMERRVALLGSAFSTDELLAVAGTSEVEAYESLEAALTTSVVEPAESGYRFRHALVRDAALATFSPLDRSREGRLVAEAPPSLRATLLVSPHHGSRSSSSPGFARAVDPRVVVHSTGHRNRFGHPTREVVDRFRDRGAVSLDTGVHGAISVRLGAHGLARLGKARDEALRYWRE